MAIEKSSQPEAFADFEQRGWDTVSDGYARHFAPLTRQAVEATLDAAGVVGGMALLDACCGPGVIASAALARGADVTGVDFSAEVVALARREVDGAGFHEGDVQALPFDDNRFDAVVCGYGIIHVPDPARALAELRRVLKPGGRVAVSVWEPPRAGNGFGLLFGAIKRHGDLDVPLPHGPDFFQFSDADRLSSALAEAGLRDVRVERVEQYWDFDHARGLVDGIMEGAVRARGLILAQTDEVRELIFADIVAGMTQFESAAGGYRLPMPGLVGAGVK